MAKSPRPKTLLVFEREPGSLRNIYASGGDGFLHDILEAAGGADVLGDIHRQSVQMSTEMVLARAPEVIIELRYSQKRHQQLRHERAGTALSTVPAVKNHRVILLTGEEFVVPGPRVVDATRAHRGGAPSERAMVNWGILASGHLVIGGTLRRALHARCPAIARRSLEARSTRAAMLALHDRHKLHPIDDVEPVHALVGFFDDDAELRDELGARASIANGAIVGADRC